MSQEVTVSPSYLCNPDVVLREEDEDGCLLFNPDTNQIRILNHTGLFIWKLCDGKHSVVDILTTLCESYADAPKEQVDDQIKEFINDMLKHGFIGIQSTEKVGISKS